MAIPTAGEHRELGVSARCHTCALGRQLVSVSSLRPPTPQHLGSGIRLSDTLVYLLSHLADPILHSSLEIRPALQVGLSSTSGLSLLGSTMAESSSLTDVCKGLFEEGGWGQGSGNFLHF